MSDLELPITCQTLSNGLRVICCPGDMNVLYCGFAIKAGTRHELETEQGMAHFVEHLIFKGTEKRKAWHILNRMEAVGGDLNAYTNKEEMVAYTAFKREDLNRAMELLVDIVFHSTFPQHEIEKETEVIIDEIESYDDNPSELIFDDFEDLLFQGHPLGHNILGRPEQLRTFGTEQALAFTKRLYHPSNMIFFLQGDTDYKKVFSQLEKLTADIPAGKVEHPAVLLPPYVAQHKVLNKDTHQTHVMIGCRGYNAYDDRRTSLYLLNNILGGPGMNSRLNVTLRERRGLVYNVESNLTSYTDTGVFCIYFGTAPDDVDKCLELTYKELKKLRDNKLTSLQLDAVKKQLKGQIVVASDSYENNALNMAKMFLHYNRFETLEMTCSRVDELSAGKLLTVANEMLDEMHLSTLIYQ